ncbi:MAG: hypothetical protein ACREVG_05540 [Burkholderiales bacterium]
MNEMTLTALRKRLFRVADRVLSTGVPARIRRRGRVLTLSADASAMATGRLARLKRRNLISGDARTLWKDRVSRWRGRASAG